MEKLMQKWDDHSLVQGFAEGNDKCFEVLLSRYKAKIFTTIYLIVKDRDTAEDIFQDVMIKMVKILRAGKYNHEGKFLPWGIRIARNLAIDFFRKNQKTPLQRSSDIASLGGDKAIPNVEDNIIKEENVRFVQGLIQQLPDKQREVLIMRNYADLSFREIAELTEVSINTALGRMRYALINLKRLADAHRHGNSNTAEIQLL